MTTKGIIFILFLILLVLHQDFWNWDNANLVFGFMPVGLAYHAGYSLIAATFWAVVIKIAWPTHLEEWAEGENLNEGGDQ